MHSTKVPAEHKTHAAYKYILFRKNNISVH